MFLGDRLATDPRLQTTNPAQMTRLEPFTAGAALPSLFEKLPDGDGFQYAIANYISEGGRSLEGLGVTPDVETPITREALLAGKDPALDAAVAWIEALVKK